MEKEKEKDKDKDKEKDKGGKEIRPIKTKFIDGEFSSCIFFSVWFDSNVYSILTY